MDLNFCKKYIGDGYPPTNHYCRDCPESNIACDNLWKLVINLANSNGGIAVSLLGTNAVLLPNFNNPNIVYLKVNKRWNLGKEDFLHFISFLLGTHRWEKPFKDKILKHHQVLQDKYHMFKQLSDN